MTPQCRRRRHVYAARQGLQRTRRRGASQRGAQDTTQARVRLGGGLIQKGVRPSEQRRLTWDALSPSSTSTAASLCTTHGVSCMVSDTRAGDSYKNSREFVAGSPPTLAVRANLSGKIRGKYDSQTQLATNQSNRQPGVIREALNDQQRAQFTALDITPLSRPDRWLPDVCRCCAQLAHTRKNRQQGKIIRSAHAPLAV